MASHTLSQTMELVSLSREDCIDDELGMMDRITQITRGILLCAMFGIHWHGQCLKHRIERSSGIGDESRLVVKAIGEDYCRPPSLIVGGLIPLFMPMFTFFSISRTLKTRPSTTIAQIPNAKKFNDATAIVQARPCSCCIFIQHNKATTDSIDSLFRQLPNHRLSSSIPVSQRGLHLDQTHHEQSAVFQRKRIDSKYAKTRFKSINYKRSISE
ncbi:hypothetical protein MRB53_039915 [Persea americana]|nr:hypothetical protein MRB53_039915 [Persea americana]